MPTRTHSHRLAAVVAALALTAPVLALAQPAATPGISTDPADDAQLYSCGKAKGQVSVSFKPEIELKDLLTWAMGFTCRNFIYEQSVMSRSKKLTIIAPNKMSAQDAYRLFLVGLATMGLTVVPKGNVLKVVESGQAKSETVPIKKGSPGNIEEFVRLILRPENVGPQDLADALAAVKSADGDIKVIAKAGLLLVTDYASHARDMATLTREIDKPSEGAGVYTIRVVHADAKQMADMLGNVLGTTSTAATSGGAAAPAGGGKAARGGSTTTAAEIEAAVPSKILADERTNTLILVSNEAAYLRVRGLVKRLDVPLETEGAGSIHVHSLQNAKAEELAQTLNNALQGITQQAGQGQAQGQRRGGNQPAPAARDSVEGAAFEGQVRITHDTPTNSLVVISSGRDFVALREVIRRLDSPRRQVFIEAVILELQASNDLGMGTSFHGGVPTDGGGLALGGLQHSNLKSLDLTSLASATGLIGGMLGEVIDTERFLGVSIPSYGVLFQALAKNRNANVLSSPHILTTDNVEAELSVGQNIPYQAGTTLAGFGVPGAGGATGVPGLTQNIQRQDIALTMKITPHLNQSDMVRLDIDLEIQDLGERDPQLGPTWTKRKFKDTVVVRDQQSTVLGGLMSDRVTYSEAKIPLLGDIPLLGYLFKYTERAKQKTNLLVLITPYIIEDTLDIERIVQRKVRERSEFLAQFSAFDAAKYMPQLDYRKKRGLLEEINSAVEGVERDIAALRAFQQEEPEIPDGAIRFEPTSSRDDGEPAAEPTPAAPEAPAGGAGKDR